MNDTCRQRREAEHFDLIYGRSMLRDDLEIPTAEIRRYCVCPNAHIFGKERLFALAQPLGGRDVLEIGCGSGTNAIYLSANGARVWAYDVSPQAIAIAKQRVQANNLADRICLTVAGSLEEAFVGEKFDVIFGNVVLHHLDLTGLGERLRRRLRAGGCCVFREPVVRCGLLAALRSLVPWHLSNPSPDERPLTDRDLRALAQPFEACEIFYYDLLSRLRPIVRSPALIPALHRADAILLACPPLRHLASSAVFRLSTQPPADVGDRRSRR